MVIAIATIIITISAIIAVVGVHGLYSFVLSLGYAGALISGFIGTSSLMISIFPPQIIVFLLSDPALGLNPLLLGILAGIGAGIGQFTHYYIGEGGRYVISEKYRKRIDTWKPRIEKYGAILIFLFAVTQFSPYDIIWIPLGMMNYPKKKALTASIIGKTVMLVTFAYGGYYGIEMIRNLLPE